MLFIYKDIYMTDIANRLKLLREEGHQIISPNFTILYNPYIDTFLLDVPEDKKDLALKAEELEDIYYWDCSGLYPVRVKFNGDYSDVWNELQPYAAGATIDLIPTGYVENGQEYVWLEHYENGYIPVSKNNLEVIR